MWFDHKCSLKEHVCHLENRGNQALGHWYAMQHKYPNMTWRSARTHWSGAGLSKMRYGLELICWDKNTPIVNIEKLWGRIGLSLSQGC